MTEAEFRTLQHRVAVEASWLSRRLSGKAATDLILLDAELMKDVRFGPQIARLLEDMEALDDA